MNRRHFIFTCMALAPLPFVASRSFSKEISSSDIMPITKSDAEWKQLLTPIQYDILRNEATERAGSSPLNDEKRDGQYHCAGCDLALFNSEMKFDSGTGWPSFYTSLPKVLETKIDFKLIFPRKEYHCARCGGHHGHIFSDGPKPTGERWCNNGAALKFIPA